MHRSVKRGQIENQRTPANSPYKLCTPQGSLLSIPNIPVLCWLGTVFQIYRIFPNPGILLPERGSEMRICQSIGDALGRGKDSNSIYRRDASTIFASAACAMKIRSTLRRSLEVCLRDAVFRGSAPDGGLYMPVEMPERLASLLKRPKQSFPFLNRFSALQEFILS
jgi:hypothetical protein